ncbi:acetylglutamate kinase [candidate division WOR-1 bacterium RIFOXYA12_FULL_43_27]|uniref:Acetylglutamate kinase n=1 Tax=candidate division WOR-1 bacterium RIFOXYC2_FULL_46_14 TaxID=1802587 RepID=A0A1F4U6U5_UNCSA|nr:MAG: acetylglutamate kinase [candidate division WOR-1 bacterium RIFOXYA12_FULL_43_27]OGC20644.1 MAG: acetylglutamate kinase [candidate division WOR-1 bacterium RIFOXYB2_FULL_46_45]OGC31619.1 MAG: acetylglutamate kinase [candidate division WOR-1 bacterium RIFOXYA2_FULL_46_56]OGC40023.1 MAG: acetylglutamate kinase [candidate division WOR-1 bacterium RIFOXYC2_FULL_46_14]
MEERIKKAKIVMEALPYIMRFYGKTIVIKYGGAAMKDPVLKESVLRDVVLLKFIGMNPILVHGGGPEINKYLEKQGIKPQFIGGYRVTDAATLKVVEKVLGGKINTQIVSMIKKMGGRAKGFWGKKGKIIKALKYYKKDEKGNRIDLGFTGQVAGIRYRYLAKWMKLGYIPVLTSIGVGKSGKTYNINADKAAAAIAAYLKASKLILMTDVRGVLDKDGKLISEVNSYKAQKMIKSGSISGGMIPKIKSSLYALRKGVEKVHIIDGRIPHALLLEIFTDYGIGTMVQK